MPRQARRRVPVWKPAYFTQPCLCTCGHNSGTGSPIVTLMGRRGIPMLTRREAAAEVSDRPFNNLLRRLNRADFALIETSLSAAKCAPNDLLYNPGQHVETVYFPCGASLVSYVVPNEDGRDVETILIGREGAVGGIVSHGYLPAYTRICVKFGGPFVRLPIRKLEVAKVKSASLRH